MNKELEELSQTILEIYKKNLDFLKNNFSNTYEKIENLSKDIQEGKIKEKYTLEFIDGYFDILNVDNGLYYHTNSYKDAEQRATILDYSTKSSLDLLRRNPNTGKLLSNPLYKDVMPIIDYINDNVNLNTIEYKKIFKFVFISTGLGLHLTEINKKLNPFTTLVIEPELEIFRLSLFTTDYSIFQTDNKKLFLSVGEDRLERQQTLKEFNNYHDYMNYSIKHYSLVESNHFIREEITDFFGRNSVASFPYKLILQNLHRTITFMRGNEKFLSAIAAQKKPILKNKKILVICAGPSLDTYIDYIEKNQKKFTIICVDVIVRKLEKHHIVPDIVVSIDPHEVCSEFLTTENPNYLDDSDIILLSQQHPDVLKVLKGKNYYFSQVMPLIKEIGYFGSVPNVGTFSFDMSIMLGGEEIFIIGNDAAFNQKTGSRYSKDSTHTQTEIIKDNKQENTFSLADVVEVKGNLKDKVKTNNSLLTFKSDFESAILEKKNTFKFKAYNLSDGVYMEGLTPMTFDNFSSRVDNFIEKSNSLPLEFDEISTLIEKLDYNKEIKIFNNIITRVKKFEKSKFKDENDFLENKLSLMIWILEKTKGTANNVFANIFLRYTALVDIYINFLLNLKQNNLHSKNSINKISKMWAKGVIILFKEMKESIKKD